MEVELEKDLVNNVYAESHAEILNSNLENRVMTYSIFTSGLHKGELIN